MSERTRRALAEDPYVLGGLCAIAALVLVFAWPLWGGVVVLACPLRELTGIPCPTCYGTRAMLALTAGDVARAFRFNPMVAFGGIGLFFAPPVALGTACGAWPRPRWDPSWLRRLAAIGALLVVGNWIYLVVFGL